MLVQLEQGYAIVAASVVKSEPLPGGPEAFPRAYAVTFTVDDVLSDPAGIEVKSGDPLPIELRVGYGSVVESWHGTAAGDGNDSDSPFPLEAKFYLTIRQDQAGRFEHAPGAGAACRVEQFEPDQARLIARLATLAALPKERRLDAMLDALTHANQSDDVRMAVLAALRHALWRDQLEPADRERVIRTITALWSDPGHAHSVQLVNAMDALLRANTRDWKHSETRRRVLLEYIFAPFPQEPDAREAAVRERDRVVWFLRDYLAHQPEEAGELVIRQMRDARWPAQFRWRLAGLLQYTYQRSDAHHPAWADALQDYYPQAIDAADPWVLRLIAGSIRDGTKNNATRPFIAGPETRHALERSTERMKRLAEQPSADIQAQNAVYDVARAIEALDAAK